MATAELEKDTISERTVKNLKFRKENGRTYSSAPYGWTNSGERGTNGKIIEGKLIPNPIEQQVIRNIKHWRHIKGDSINQIAATLNFNQIPSKKGGLWSAKTVSDVLNNSLNNLD